MSHQLTFADSEFSTKAARSDPKRDFPSPAWSRFCHGKNMNRCHRARFIPRRAMADDGPIRWRTMLGVFNCMQHWYNLSDGAMEECPVRNRLHAPVCPIIPG
ncbi:transposase insH for insertion sequence element IS5T [Escherichia coli O104:H4 str. 11-3677]|nr:transposase insH for insertion sequence element IS5T [Escherichia coli O104:H4 str. 11-3677]